MTSFGIEVLAFAAHPDDVEAFCGGFMLKMSSLGYSTGIVDLTRGEMATRGNAEIRASEAAAASKLLGLSLRENLGFPDGAIEAFAMPATDNRDQLSQLVACLRRHRPELVLAPYPQGRHPDHPAASTLISRAIFFSGAANFKCGTSETAFRPRQLLFYQERFTFKPSFVCDISAVFEQKMATIKCFRSQVGLDESSKNQPHTLIGSALSLPALEARDQFYGAMIGTRYGEPLMCYNALQVDDPLSLLRAREPLQEALFYPPL